MQRRNTPVLAAVLAGAAVAASVLAGTAASAATTARATSEPLRYVALGDSYSAASGVVPVDPTAPPQCLRSTSNYPHVIASRTGAALTDVTCGAAQTKDYFSPQYDGMRRSSTRCTGAPSWSR